MEGDMRIRPAGEADLPAMLRVYEAARSFMVEQGNPHQWADSGWPPASVISEDIEVGKSFVCETDGRVVACFFYDFGEAIEPTYNVIDGAWIATGPYGVVHRIASDGSARGAGAACLRWALEQSKHLRIDTHEDNRPMRNLLGKLGFTECGIITLENGDPRIAFEKLA